VFRRVVTRSITVKALPGSIRSNGSLALTSGSGNGATMNFNAETDTDFWVTLDKTLPLMVSSQGQFIVDAKLGVVTVRDAHDNVAAIEKMIESNNGLLMRQVAMHVEVLQVDLALEHQSGIDWNLVSDTLAKSNSLISLTGAPVLASNNIPATFGIKSINSSGQVSSQVLLKMLEKFGRVSTAYSSVLTTMNRQSVPVGVLNTLSYLKAITPATLTTGNSSPTNSGVGLVPGEITTGFSLNLIPMVMDSNRVLLQCSISISSLRELSKFSSGSGDNTQSIQQPSVDSFSSIQRMALNTGETMVIMGFERDESRSNQTDVVRNQIPGSRMASSNRKSTVILVTPRLIGI
jgi:type IVB pilus formation R64 PilN family outer membrane protein